MCCKSPLGKSYIVNAILHLSISFVEWKSHQLVEIEKCIAWLGAGSEGKARRTQEGITKRSKKDIE